MNQSQSLTRLIMASWLGTLLEWYDFSVYGFLAPILSVVFFPNDDRWVGLLLAYSVFAIGYLVRPIGGLIFGSMGDKKGRKKTLIYTILLMSLPTCAIGLLPTYASIGIWAPCLLIVLRLLQGIAAGGEVIGATTFVYESSPKHRRALLSAMLFVGTGFGIVLGSLVVTVLHAKFSADQMQQFGWRIPFLLAIFSAVIGPWLRCFTAESAEFAQLQTKNLLELRPLVRIWQDQKMLLLRVALLFAPGAVLFYMNFVFLPGMLSGMAGFNGHTIMALNTGATLLLLVMSLVFGYVADAWDKRKMIIVALSLLLVLCLPLYGLLSTLNFWVVALVQCSFALLIAMLTGPMMAYLLGQSATATRYSATAVAYNVSYSIFGGTAPLVAALLLHGSGHFVWLGVYIVIVLMAALWAIVATSRVRKSARSIC